jgi:methanogenic corrinoid protein MtbC1
MKGEVEAGAFTGEVLLHVLESDEAVRARGLITAAFLGGRKPADLFDGPIKEALVVLGERWRQSHTGIYLEHRATQVIIEAVNQVHMLIPPPGTDAPVAVGGAPPDDPYLLPSLMAATVLADLGYRDINLGAHTPAATLLDAVEAHRPRIAWVAATAGDPFAEDQASWERALSEMHARGVRVVVGGQAVEHLLEAPWPSGVRALASMAELAAFGASVLRTLSTEGRDGG